MFWKQISIINLVVALSVLGFLIFRLPAEPATGGSANAVLNNNNDYYTNNNYADQDIEELNNPTPGNLNLEAKSACVFDLRTNKFIFELNGNTQLPLASLTKLMTALTAKENMPEGTIIEIADEAIAQEGNNGLIAGEKWLLKDLLRAMLISSSNDAAHAIALSYGNSDEPFIKLMNKMAGEIGLKQTFFLNATGLDYSENIAGAYGSCENIAKLLAYIIKNQPELMDATTQHSVVINGTTFSNTNVLVEKIPFLIGGKTGYSDLAGGNLTIICNKNINNPIIIVVLGSSVDGRFNDVEKLYNNFIYGFGYN